MLKEQDVKQYLNEKNIAFQENASIIGVLFPNKVTYAFGPVAAALSMQYFAMNLINTTVKLEEEAILFVPMAEITDVKFNQKLLAYELEIMTAKGILAFKVNKTMIGASWHKNNLVKILEKTRGLS